MPAHPLGVTGRLRPDPAALARALCGETGVRAAFGRMPFTAPLPPEVATDWSRARRGGAGRLWRALCDAVDESGAEAVALSGGLDSAGLLAAVVEVRGRALALVLRGAHVPAEDVKRAKRAARRCGAELEAVDVAAEELPSRFARCVVTCGELVYNAAAVARGPFHEAAARLGVRTLLSGIGADEVLVGNPAALRRMGVHQFWERRAMAPLLKVGLPAAERLPTGLRARRARQILVDLPARTMPPELAQAAAAGVRVVLPYLETRFAALALGLPLSVLVRKGKGKRPLRKALRGRVPKIIRRAAKRPGLALPPADPALRRAWAAELRRWTTAEHLDALEIVDAARTAELLDEYERRPAASPGLGRIEATLMRIASAAILQDAWSPNPARNVVEMPWRG